MTHVGSFCIAMFMAALFCACGYGSGSGEPDGALEDAADGDGGDLELTDGPVVDGTAGDDGGAPADDGRECSKDSDCQAGAEWCVGGNCVPCSNDGLVCDLACFNGWIMYERNGCYPCECAPPNACAGDSDCGGGMKCYAGAFCWDWCPADDPSCCYGNICSGAGCTVPPPGGCFVRGCPPGGTCSTSGCQPSDCGCDSGGWVCTDDCGGGECL